MVHAGREDDTIVGGGRAATHIHMYRNIYIYIYVYVYVNISNYAYSGTIQLHAAFGVQASFRPPAPATSASVRLSAGVTPRGRMYGSYRLWEKVSILHSGSKE